MCVHIDLYVYKDHLLFVLNTYRCRRVLAKSTSRNICLKNSYVQCSPLPVLATVIWPGPRAGPLQLQKTDPDEVEEFSLIK